MQLETLRGLRVHTIFALQYFAMAAVEPWGVNAEVTGSGR